MSPEVTKQSGAISATGLLALAVGAVAFGAIAIGALAIGRLAIGRLVIRRARFNELEVDDCVLLNKKGQVRDARGPGTSLSLRATFA